MTLTKPGTHKFQAMTVIVRDAKKYKITNEQLKVCRVFFLLQRMLFCNVPVVTWTSSVYKIVEQISLIAW